MNLKRLYTGRAIGFAAVIILIGIFMLAKFAPPPAVPIVPALGGETITPVTLIDGKTYNGGVFHDSPVTNSKKSYTSTHFDISFDYPSDYVLFEGLTEGGPQAQYSFVAGSIVMGLDLPVRQSIARAQAGHSGESGAGMALTFYARQNQSLSLEDWLRSNPSGNFNPAFDPGAEKTLAPTTVGGVPALTYHSDMGMYATDYVAFAYGKWFVLASFNNTEDNKKEAFETVLSSIQLQ